MVTKPAPLAQEIAGNARSVETQHATLGRRPARTALQIAAFVPLCAETRSVNKMKIVAIVPSTVVSAQPSAETRSVSWRMGKIV
jgi:hypothetical protein